MSKKFKTYKMEEVKFNEFADFDEFSMYTNIGLNLDDVNNFVDPNKFLSLVILLCISAKIHNLKIQEFDEKHKRGVL